MYDLKLTPSQFRKLTPSQFRVLLKRNKVAIQRADYRAGLIASILYNINRGDLPERTAASFFSSLTELEEEEKKSTKKAEKVQSADQQKSFLEALFGPAPS